MIEKIRKDIKAIDGHVANVGIAIDKVKKSMIDMLDLIEQLSQGYLNEKVELDSNDE